MTLTAAQDAFHRRDLAVARALSMSLLEGGEEDSARLLLARIATEERQYGEALAWCEPVPSGRAPDARLKAQASYAHLLLGRYEAALAAAKAALVAAGADAESLDLAAAVFHALADYEPAATALRTAVVMAPGNPGLLCNLGAVLTLCGDLTEARAAFERAIELAPDSHQALAALSELRPATPERNNLPLIVESLDRVGEPRARLALHHALARELEALGDIEQAAAVLHRGKAEMQRRIGDAGPRDRETFAALLRLAAQPAQRDGYSQARPIFVVGMPRSGTTIVEQMLTACPGVGSIGESLFLARALRAASRGRGRGLVDGAALERAWAELDVLGVGRAYAEQAAALRPASTRIVDKLPLNLLIAPAILRALPRASIICLLRDRPDVVVGNYRQMFEYESGAYDYNLSVEGTAEQADHAETLASILASRHPDRVLVVRYEDLVRNAPDAGERIFNFVDLPWSADFAAIERNRRPVGSASAVQVRSALHGGRIGSSAAWRPFLSNLS